MGDDGQPPAWRLAAGCAWLATLAYAVGAAATHLVAPDDTLARVSPSSGVWLLLFAWAVLVADALARLAFGPWRRLAALVVAIAAISVPLASGWWDGLSVMREYAVRSDDFWIEAIRHVSLTGGSVAAALVAGVPLGIACARIATVRTVAMPVLNIVQTIPSIAMYGLMMAPLGLLAAHVPLAAALGIRASASLLPCLRCSCIRCCQSRRASWSKPVGAAARDRSGARDGMTRAQRLLSVDLVLALPVILSGVRIVLVQNIGLTAVAALIGGGGFGTFIFQDRAIGRRSRAARRDPDDRARAGGGRHIRSRDHAREGRAG